jgi:hypothetical protein
LENSVPAKAQVFILEDNQHAVSPFIQFITISNLHNFGKISPVGLLLPGHKVCAHCKISDKMFAETSGNDQVPQKRNR